MDNKKKTFLYHWLFFFLSLMSLSLLFFKISDKPLVDWDECIYAEYAREMKIFHNFLVYQWNNSLLFEKPPFYGWLLQLFYFFNINEFTSRLPSFILGISNIYLVYIFSYQYFSFLVGVISGLIMLTLSNFVLYSTRVNTDIGFSFFIFAGFYAAILSFKREKFDYFSGLFFGLAVMMKGLSAIIFMLPIFFIYLISKKNVKKIAKLMISFLFTILPWHLYQFFVYKEVFIKEYFIDNLLIRSTRSIFPPKNFFYYLNSIIKDTLPWNLFLILYFFLLINKLKIKLKKKLILNKVEEKKVFMIIILMAFIPLFIFSLIKTKIIWYLIPIYPFVAIIIAISISYTLDKFQKKIFKIIIILCLLIQILIINFREHRKILLYEDGLSADVGLKAKVLPINEINYLVGEEYRYLKKKEKDLGLINAQLRYGDCPCIIFYSQKKINLFYSEEIFKKRLKSYKGLFIVQKEDERIVKNMIKDLIYENKKFILFYN